MSKRSLSVQSPAFDAVHSSHHGDCSLLRNTAVPASKIPRSQRMGTEHTQQAPRAKGVSPMRRGKGRLQASSGKELTQPHERGIASKMVLTDLPGGFPRRQILFSDDKSQQATRLIGASSGGKWKDFVHAPVGGVAPRAFFTSRHHSGWRSDARLRRSCTNTVILELSPTRP